MALGMTAMMTEPPLGAAYDLVVKEMALYCSSMKAWTDRAFTDFIVKHALPEGYSGNKIPSTSSN